MKKTRALYAGSFDPITLGHLDIIMRSLQLCDELIIAVANNFNKSPLFSLERRIDLIRQSLEQTPHIRIITTDRLIAEIAREHQVSLLIRSCRNSNDFIYEQQLAEINHQLNPQLETIILCARAPLTHISSTAVREIISYQGDLHGWVSDRIIHAISKK